MPDAKPKLEPGAHPAIYDQPLPGHYPILTLQVNVTRYQSEKVGKMVLVIREPTSQIEVAREFEEMQAAVDVERAVEAHVRSAMARMRYLQEGTAV